MLIDQTKVMDKMSHHTENDINDNGIKNYIKEDGRKGGIFSEGAFSGVIENYAKTKNSGNVQKIGSVNMADATYQNIFDNDEDKSVLDDLEQNEGTSAEQRRNRMAVIANTTSPEDLKEIEKDGFDVSDTNSHTIITETDKIKAVLAKSGVDISIYGDELSSEELAQITGSQELARQIENKLKEYDLPVTEKNVEDMIKAYEQVSSIDNISEDAIAYIMKNRLEPTIANMYMAQFSGYNISRAYQQEMGLSDDEIENMMDQINEILDEYGIESNDDAVEVCKWLIKNDIPVTRENIIYADDLRSLSDELQYCNFDPNIENEENDYVFDAMAQAIIEGGRPENAMLIEGISLQDQAEKAMDIIMKTTTGNLEYCVKRGMEFNIHNIEIAQSVMKNNIQNEEVDVYENTRKKEDEHENIRINEDRSGYSEITIGTSNQVNGSIEKENNYIDNSVEQVRQYTSSQIAVITAQRQLEEIRLEMTVEANFSLLKKGIAIDTEPLEKLIEELKAQENAYYRNLLSNNGVEPSDENVGVFKDTTVMMEELKSQPAYVISPLSAEESIRALHSAGNVMKQDFEKANKSYESLFIEPGEEYGDDISKAFSNIDKILETMDIEANEANKRAVRILGYNETEISVENIQKTKAADEQVQRAFSNMTPAVTLEMIRRGINPLDISIDDLNKIAEKIKEITNDKNEKFSKFLWKLEKNNEITEKERRSYIGIYRLIAQVEKTDGAVIGSLLNQGMDITMRNLLTAVRGKNKIGMDYKIDDSFSGIKYSYMGEKIDLQIEAAYQLNCIHDVMDEISSAKIQSLFGDEWNDMTPEQLKMSLQEGIMNENPDIDEQALSEQTDIDSQIEYEYAQQQLEDFQEASFTSEDVYSLMERYDINDNMANILASSKLLKNPNQALRDLFEKEDIPEDKMQMINDMKETVIERFGEAIKTPEEMADAQETLEEVATHVMDTMVMEGETISVADLKRLRLMNTQFQICSQKAKEESFLIPVQTGDSVTGISLKIVRGKEDKGLIDIFFRGELMGKVAATFEAKKNGVNGTLAVSDEETKNCILDNLEQIKSLIKENEVGDIDLCVAVVPDLSQEKFELSSIRKEKNMNSEKNDDMKNDKNSVQTKRLYHIAESFIKTVADIIY